MRKTLMISGALLALTPTPALSSGVELAWNHCFGQAGAVSLRTSACTVDTGSQSMIASFRPPAGVSALEGIEVFIDYQVTGGTLGCWWNLASRAGSSVPLHVSPTDANGAPLILCDNHYFRDNNAAGGGGMVVLGADLGQLRGIAAIAAGTGLPVAMDAQQYGAGFRITNALTTTCAGCLNAACFVLLMINLTSAGLPNVVLQSPHPGSDQQVTWQVSNFPYLCFTPVQSRTWGEIKSLYR